jgi:hypothetical protein
MDPELNEKLRELYYSIHAVRSQTNNFGYATSMLTDTSKSNIQAVNNNTQAQNSNRTGKTRYQQIVDEEDQKSQKFKASIEKSFGHSVDMLVNFGGALVSPQTGLQKYGSTLQSLSKGSNELFSNFGLLGKSAGGLLGIFGKLATYVLGMNDNILNIRNNFAKAGGILPTTTENLGHLAKEAGFAMDSMKVLGDKMAELSESMSSLGGYSGEGALKFMQIANVEDSVRREFGRLGVSQDQLLELQGMYVESQRLSGGYMVNENKSAAEMQTESLQYAKTLLALSSLTGKSVAELQKEMNAARLEIREQLRQYKEQKEIARLKSLGRIDEAKALERRAKNRKATIDVFSALYDRETAIQFATLMETGVITEENAGLGLLIPNVQHLAMSLRESSDIASDLSSAVGDIDNSYRDMAGAMTKAVDHYPEIADKFGVRLEAMSKVNSRAETSLETIRQIIEGKMTDEESDQLAESVEDVRLLERNSKKFFQTLLEYIDPMRNLNNWLTKALTAAAVALTGLAVVKIGGSLLGGLFDRGASSMRPNHIVVSGMSGLVGGGSAAFAGSAADPTGLGLRKADLVDKNGKPLGGAALDARLRKISEERTPRTTSFALKQAAKNSGRILKGAATLAGAITIIGAGIGTATWMMSGAIGTFAESLAKFNEVDGKNLKSVGIGMTGLGAGILALAAEKIVGFFNGIASVFGAKSPLERAIEKLQEFEKIDIDANKIERNGKAALMFARVFKNMPATTASFSGMLAGFFSGPPMPYNEFEKFAKMEVDVGKADTNSKAFIAFTKAIASFTGAGLIGGLGATATALADAVIQYYKMDPPEERLKAFSDLDINPELVGQNAIAFKDFAEGMRDYRGPPGILSNISSLIGTQISRIFGPGSPVEAFVQFSKDTKDVGEHAAKNARAFFNFARALGMLSRVSGTSGVVSGFFSHIRARGDASDPTLTQAGSWSGVGSEVDVSTAKGAWRNDQAFLQEVQRVSSKYGFSQGALLGLMQSESGINPQSVNPKSGATGLIQFMPSTARGLGTSTDALRRMNRPQQMAFVDKFFAPYASGLSGASAGKLYAYVFLPARANRKSGVLTSAPEKYYNENRGLDMNRDGSITISDLDQRIAKKAKEAKVGGLFTGPTSGYPMELHGTELIVPVDSNSILMKLATEAQKPDTNVVSALTNNKNTVQDIKNNIRNRIDPARLESISTMFDKIIDTIESTDDIDKKILQYS